MEATRAIPEERSLGATSDSVFGMILFVASEAMFFAAFFGAYFTLRALALTWPPAGIHLEIGLPTILTIILIASSLVLQVGVRSIRRGSVNGLTLWLGLTLLLGITFLALQAYDYSQLTFGIKDGIFGSLFYVMTGLHMAHVFGGVVFLGLVLVQARSGELSAEHHDPVIAGAIYWDFVDLVWVGLYAVFYLLTR